MARADVKTRRWKRVEYERLIESGFFQPGDPIELVGGPDVAVVPGTFRDYVIGHPSQPVLVVEVSESSLALDREHKGSVYARARVADYWMVNLVDRVLEVYREPIGDQAAPFGWRYRSIEVLEPSASVAPLAVADARLLVADLLP